MRPGEITHEFEFLTSTFIEFRAILGQNRDNTGECDNLRLAVLLAFFFLV